MKTSLYFGVTTPDTSLSLSTQFRRLLSLTLPLTIGMLFNALYVMVDAFFVAHYVSDTAFAAVSAIFPLSMLAAALAMTVANGTSVLVSQQLGKADSAHAFWHYRQGLFLATSIGALLTVLALVFYHPILSFLGLPEAIKGLAANYFLLMFGGNIIMFRLNILADTLRAHQRSVALLQVIACGALLNIAFDALFIVVFKWGVTGAALATIAAQILSLVLAHHFLHRDGNFASAPSAPSAPQQSGLKRRIMLTGLPSGLMYLGSGLIMLLCTYLIGHYWPSDESVNLLSAYGLVARIGIMLSLPMMALTSSCQTLCATHYGASEHLQVRYTLILSLASAILYLTLMTLALRLGATTIGSWFVTNTMALSSIGDIIDVMYLLLPLAGIAAITTAGLQATGQPLKGLMITLLKTYGLLLPLLSLLPLLFGRHAMWYAFPVAEGGVVIVAAWLLISVNRNVQTAGTKEAR